MNLSDEQLETIKELSGLFLSIREIACMLEIDFETFDQMVQNTNTPAYMAYLIGKTQSKYEIRLKIVALAKMGSPPAQTLAEKFIEEQTIEDYE